jgi:alkylated DNA repair protein (DNA oxidative demethylase)
MDLFDDLPPEPDASQLALAPGAVLLRTFARSEAAILLQATQAVLLQAPWRHMQTPGGYTMSVSTSSCGAQGWVSDARGYRYAACDPQSGQAWPAMPACFLHLAERAAAAAGYADFEPESCLINQYVPGAKLSLHQDKDEKDLSAPIVSVSLGLPATFLFGGAARGRGRSVTGWRMAMWWFGAAPRAWPFTAWRLWKTGTTRCWGPGAST